MGKLFVVDNDRFLLFALQLWFRKKGYDVITFYNSKDLLYQLKSCTPDFILMDVFLDGEHGGKICKHLKKDLRIPATIYLHSHTVFTYEQFYEYRADGFILKRGDFEDLTKMIAQHMPVL